MKDYIYHIEDKDIFVNIPTTEDGIPCWYYLLEGPIFKQAGAYAAIKRDLNDCKNAVDLLIKDINDPHFLDIIKTSLSFATIIKYSRCFNTGKGRGTSLNSAQLFRGLDPMHLDFHKEIMEIRNKYLAHAGESPYETGTMMLILNPDAENKEIKHTRFSGFSLKDDDSNLNKYKKIIEIVIQYVDDKIEYLKPLINKMVLDLDLNVIYQNANVPDPDRLKPFPVNYID
ncbi:MAG: hypothetical protein DHS20C13_25330 [Thermodesulfobacteriota bacterium]|nr:MAG: hypothetical protein DHS20C13_25330 [Thermodesulfobacteriota bacterium]GJM36340.1 MAG: hypothetical protein DHS20C18_53410 [Saprospiraceae bacterium]